MGLTTKSFVAALALFFGVGAVVNFAIDRIASLTEMPDVWSFILKFGAAAGLTTLLMLVIVRRSKDS